MFDNPVLVSVAVMLAAFALGHIIPARAYNAGLKATIAVGILFIGLAFLFLILGFSLASPVWRNVFGLCAGICFWVFYGEVLETMQGDFDVTTGVEVNHGNLPLLVVLGVAGWLVVFQYRLVTDVMLLQALNAFYFTWLLHVVLLTVYYAPAFGGATVEHGEKTPAVKVWSKGRKAAGFIVGGIYSVVAIPFAAYLGFTTGSVAIQVACGFYLVILVWSVLMELRKKLYCP